MILASLGRSKPARSTSEMGAGGMRSSECSVLKYLSFKCSGLWAFHQTHRHAGDRRATHKPCPAALPGGSFIPPREAGRGDAGSAVGGATTSQPASAPQPPPPPFGR